MMPRRGTHRWQPPTFYGLENSEKVTITHRHWYNTDESSAGAGANGGLAAAPMLQPNEPALKVARPCHQPHCTRATARPARPPGVAPGAG